MKTFQNPVKTASLNSSILSIVYKDIKFLLGIIAKALVAFVNSARGLLSFVSIDGIIRNTKDIYILFTLLLKKRNIAKLIRHLNKELSKAMYNVF